MCVCVCVCVCSEKVDDFASIVTADWYFAFRLKKHQRFLQRRLPGYHRQHTIYTLAVLVSAIGTVLLAYLSFEECVRVESCALVLIG